MAEKINLEQWSFKDQHTQETLEGENFISSESIVLCSGPNKSDGVTLDQLIPIGVLENASVVQNKQIQQLFEIGSRKPFTIPGRTRVQVGLSRVIFNGDSLLGALYRGNSNTSIDSITNPPGTTGTVTTSNAVDVNGNFYMNLASDFFNRPLGLAMLFADSENEYVSLIYLENCNVQSHQMSIGANQTVIVENCNMICDGIVPISLSTDI